jgi:ABC-type cobalamin/Fe3+-siderophores transport system ATPase subunit
VAEVLEVTPTAGTLGSEVYSWPGGGFFLPGDGAWDEGGRLYCNLATFTLRRGSVTALHGESGCGKSFFLSLLADVAENPPEGLPDGFRKISRPFAFLPQFSAFHADLTVRGEVLSVWRKTASSLEAAGFPVPLANAEYQRRIQILAELFFGDNARPILKRKIEKLSGGEKKRVALMLRICFPADILLLDEPDSGLDIRAACRMLSAIQQVPEKIWGKPGAAPALLLVSHQEGLPDALRGLSEGMDVVVIPVEKSQEPQPDSQATPNKNQSGAPPRNAMHSPEEEEPDQMLRGMLARTWREFGHQVRLLGNAHNLFIIIFAPVLIFILLDLTDSALAQEGDKAKYLLFALMSMTWLGAQFSFKIPVEHARIIREDAWFRKNLLAGGASPPKRLLYALPVFLGYALMALLVAVPMAVIAWVAVGHKTGDFSTYPIFSSDYMGFLLKEKPLLLLPFFLAATYGAAIGYGISGLAVWLTTLKCIPSRRLPGLVWPSLIVPVVLLCHIVFTAVYLRGDAYDRDAIFSGALLNFLTAANLLNHLEQWAVSYIWGQSAPLEILQCFLNPGFVLLIVFFTLAFCGFQRLVSLPDLR